MGSKRTAGALSRRSHNAKRVASTPAKKRASATRVVTTPKPSTVRSRISRGNQKSWESIVDTAVRAWSSSCPGVEVERRLKTAARKKGGRPLSHNIYDIQPGEKVMVLHSVTGRERLATWKQHKVIATRQLRRNHSRAIIRHMTTPAGIVEVPSSVVVVEDTLGRRRDRSYISAFHDWQCIPTRFFTKRNYAVLEARHCRRKSAGKKGLVDGGDMVYLTPMGWKKVRPRCRVVVDPSTTGW
jgi:hypothetical protein